MFAKMKKTDNEAKMNALKALNSSVTKQVLEEMVAKYVFDTGASTEEIIFDPVISDYRPGRINATIYINDKDCYEWLMNQSSTAISDKISSSVTKTMYFASYGGTHVELQFYISCDLPKEDFAILDMLGKVHREYKPGKMEQFIYCEI